MLFKSWFKIPPTICKDCKYVIHGEQCAKVKKTNYIYGGTYTEFCRNINLYGACRYYKKIEKIK